MPIRANIKEVDESQIMLEQVTVPDTIVKSIIQKPPDTQDDDFFKPTQNEVVTETV